MKRDTKRTVIFLIEGLYCHLSAISAGDRRRRGGHGVTKVQMCDDVE